MTTPTRRRFDLNNGWRFVRESLPARKLDRALQHGDLVDLPHCWNVQDTFQTDVRYYRGPGTYIRSFRLPELAEDKAESRLILVSEGFYGLAEILVDRRRVARLDGQYMGFRLDLSPWIDATREHEIAIRLTNRCPRWVLPGTSRPDFLLFGGLAGRLFLEVVPETHLIPGAARIVTEDVLSGSPRIRIAYPIDRARRDPGFLTLRATLADPKGVRASAVEIPLDGAKETSEVPCTVELVLDPVDPILWSPESPSLYRLEIDLQLDGECLDRAVHRVGLREARFDDRGFHLNGERYVLQGFNRHESLPGLGNALPGWLHREDAQTLKDHGANLVRLSHYPQHPDFLDACDELGLLVYAELASWKTARGGRWRRSALRQMEAMILRDRNRPSSLLWGMGNEAQHLGTYRALAELIHELDPGRPATYAESHFYRGKRAGLPGLPDVWSCNYDVESLDDQHLASGTGAVLVSECCNDQAQRGCLEEEIDQAKRMLDLWKSLEGKPYLAGYLLWSFADYPTLFRKRYTRYTGKFDSWRQPKLSAAVFKARHSPELFVEVFGSWARQGPANRKLAIATNATSLELRMGDQVTTLNFDSYLVVHDLPYRSEVLHVEGRRAGESVGQKLEPWGRASSLRLDAEQDRSPAASRDWVGLRIQVLDEDGARVRDWQGECRMESDGPGRMMTYTAADQVLISAGSGRTFMRSSGQVGRFRARAVTDGLDWGETEIDFHGDAVEGASREI